METNGLNAGEAANGDRVVNADMGPLVKKLRGIRDGLTKGLMERDLAVRLGLLAALSGEHLLLLGPPGTAKSLVARRLRLAIREGTYFERLLTRFSVPEELFGPLSISGLQEDRYERLTQSYLPAASIAFLDEIFKANSAILNSLLTLLNERVFHNGAKAVQTPLVAVIGASNELPEGEELDALLDRFLLRLHVGPVSGKAFPQLMTLSDEGDPELADDLKLTSEDLSRIQTAVDQVRIPEGVLAMLGDLREWCIAEGIRVSDRRWRKVAKLLRTSAWTNGRDSVGDWDCWLLQHCLGEQEEDRSKVYEWYASRVGAVAAQPEQLIRLVCAWERRLKQHRQDERVRKNESGQRLYVSGDGGETTAQEGPAYRDGEPLFLGPKSARYYPNERVDRTNGGKGFTKTEIKDMMQRGGYGSSQGRISEHVKDTDNRFTAKHEPALEPMAYPRAQIEQFLADLKDVRERVSAFREGLWEERVRAWAAVAEVFGDLGMLLGRGWDLTLGILRHVGWREITALRQLLEQLPQLREIVQSLGRLQETDSQETDESVADRLFGPVRRLEEELRSIRAPLVPEETKGIELSDVIPRMLPSEAAMLGQPVLKYLWHARRAERALLTYRVEGVEIGRPWVEREDVAERPAPRRGRGPIMAVVDTSGSMHGPPETVAKALVLEALRTAHAERRRCYVYAFSGPGQTAEHELDLSPEGIGRLLDFLGMSFHGGTDPREVMKLVVKRLSEPAWRKADILVASDGEWPTPHGGAVSKVRSAREAGTRFHGVQIGNRGATGLAAICDPVHEFDAWVDIA